MKSATKLTEDELVQKCLENDRRSQRELYRRHAPLMKGVCRRYLFEQGRAEEVLNQAFYKVYTRLNSFDGRGSFEGWMRRIVVNECLNENKKKRSDYGVSDAEEAAFLSETPAVNSEHNLEFIMKVIAALPAGYRSIFNLFEIEGYTHTEIAAKLNISESSSRSQLARAKQLLRKKLKNIKGL